MVWINFFLCFVFLFGANNVDGVLVVVENEVLLKSDVLQQSYVLASQKNIDPYKNPEEFEFLYDAVLGQMVDNLVLYDLASKDTNIVVLDEVVEESLGVELKRRIDLAGSVSSLEQMLGEPLSLIRSKLRLEIKKSMQIEMYTSSLVQSIFPSVSDVKSFYSTYKDSLPLLENRYSFSVLEWPVSINKNKKDAVLTFLSNVKDSVVRGEDFSVLAKKHSDDLGSSKNGGSLGYTLRGSLVPAYEEVAYSLSVGEVSEPFESPFGFHLVLLEGRVGEKINSSHILKRVVFDENDFAVSLDSLNFFLDEQLVYKHVNKFDSLCSHYQKKEKVFQGVFYDVPQGALPEFLAFISSSPFGFLPPFVHENNLYVVRFFGASGKEKATIKNSYENIYNLTRSKLIEDEITQVINEHSDKIYIKKFY
tara:strand:- start:2145 stop:3404 length:1260 start_codon:yes stop_codon:yes gene_type:complete